MSSGGFLLSVVMPVFNEHATLSASIRRLHAVGLNVELICVDDASTDGSVEILRQLKDEGLIDRLEFHQKNQGKGTAVRAGFGLATGHAVAILDADLEYDPHDFVGLLEPIQEGRADAVFGSRFLSGPRRVLYFWHRVGNTALTLLSNMLTDLDLTDMETCLKVIRTDLLQSLPLTARRFGIEPELTARLSQAGARLYEAPISYRGRTYAEGKKINWKDGIAAIWHILRFNLLPPQAPPWTGPQEADPLSL